MIRWRNLVVVFLTLWLAMSTALAQSDRFETARRHMVRGAAALEMAKSSGDLVDAATEFRKATEIAPEMALAWFNLGAIETKLGHYAEAMAAYKRYLKLSPTATDTEKVKDEIIKLEYQMERTAKRQQLIGNWTARLPNGNKGTDTFRVALNGNEFRLEPLSNYQWLSREFRLFTPDYIHGGKLIQVRSPKIDNPKVVFVGRLEGEKITGERIRPGFYDKESKCQLDDHRTPFEGHFEENGEVLVISYDEPRYRGVWDFISIFGQGPDNEHCVRVETDPPEHMEFRLARDTYSVGIQPVASADGESVTVGEVKPGTAANFEGIVAGDQILALDGQEVRGMSESMLKSKLWGRQGQSVRVRVNRDGWSAPVELTLLYGDVPWPGGKPFGKGQIGVKLSYALTSNKGTPAWNYRIAEVVAGGPAAMAGVQVGGDIVEANGGDLTSRSFLNALALLRGEPGSLARLTVRYPDGNKVEYQIIRQEEAPAKK